LSGRNGLVAQQSKSDFLQPHQHYDINLIMG